MGRERKKKDLKTEHTRISDMQAFKLCLHSLCVEHTQMSLYFQLRHMPCFATKNNICASCAALWCSSTESPGTGPVLLMQMNAFVGEGWKGGGWGGGVFWKPHWLADIAGHDGCCQHRCLATQYPSRQSSGLAGSKKQAGLVQHSTGHGKIMV